MLTFFGEPKIKAAIARRVAEHKRLDQIIQGVYWKDHHGCFVGCLLHSDRHADFERLLGLPEWFARLGESIFERLDRPAAPSFPLNLVNAIPVGVELDQVKLRFLRWLILDPEHGVVRHTSDARVAHVGHCLDAALRGEAVDWAAAAGAAGAAAWSAARAAWSAARSAADAAAGAAWAADAAADAAGAAGAAWAGGAADHLISLLRSVPVPETSVALPTDPAFTRFYFSVVSEAQ